MVKELKMMNLPADSELAVWLRDARRAGTPVMVDTGDTVYALSIEVITDKTATPTAVDVARSEAGIREAAGAWKDLVDPDAFKAYISERRQTSSRPAVRL